MPTPLKLYIALLAVLSLVTLVLYGTDKARAKRGAWRISERTLLLCSLLGGAIGGLIAMRLFRHKTRHWYFWAVNFLALTVHIAMLAYLLIS